MTLASSVTRFDQNLTLRPIFGKNLIVYLVFGNIVNWLQQFFAFGPIFYRYKLQNIEQTLWASGHTACHTRHTAFHTGHPACHTGHTACHTGHSACHTGHPACHTGHTACHTRHTAFHTGHTAFRPGMSPCSCWQSSSSSTSCWQNL